MTTAAPNAESHSGAARPSVWQTPWMNTLGRFLALVAVFAFFALLVKDGNFYTLRNLENIARQSAVYATAAIGMTFVIIAAGIDLSIGAIIALTVVVLAWTLNLPYHNVAADGTSHAGKLIEHWPVMLPILALLAGILAATLAGFVNGVLVVSLRLVPFIVTLGTMMIFRAVAKGIAHEKDIYPPRTWLNDILDPTLVPFLDWLNGKPGTKPPTGLGWLVLPLGVWILIVVAIVAAILLRYTRFGRHVFAIGSNEDTARLCGVRVERTKAAVYMLSAFFTSLAAVMEYSSINGIGQPTDAIGYELYVIAAVVIGGGSLLGGEGTILGSLIGAVIITILYMGGHQMDWPQWVQEAVIGGIIIAAVTLDRLRHRNVS